ncbi:hypothetical protein [Thalassobaculum sp.]|uniref:hypothetical protein n=1 Tax=Thalassobaculum sp. TaxID=2022740 RepID=UPI0032EC9E41
MIAVLHNPSGTIRLLCEVPHCPRTRGRRKGETEIQDGERWICGDHWRLVSRSMKAIYRRARRRAASGKGSWEAAHRLWMRCRREAIEIAVGIKS